MKIKKLLFPIVLLALLPNVNAQKYPYVKDGGKNGPVIVSRDDNGGVHPDALLGSNDNTIEALLQVEGQDAVIDAVSWSDAQKACVGGWRLPTKRELQLIWLMSSDAISEINLTTQNDFAQLEATEYWTSTAGGWYVSFVDGTVASNTTVARKVRCVKSEQTPIAYPSGMFAYSNIVLKDGKLVFATRRNGKSNSISGVYSTADNLPANSQGLQFGWGSLVGISCIGTAGAAFAPTHVVFSPSGYPKPAGWAGVPYITATLGNYVETVDHMMSAYPVNGYNVSEGKGDICRYISDQGWVEGRWRMPKMSEINQFVTSTPGKTGNYYGVRANPYASGYETIDTADGRQQIANGWWFGSGATNAVNSDANKVTPPENALFFPAGGLRHLNDGTLYYPGQNGHSWSSTASDSTRGFFLYVNGSALTYKVMMPKSVGLIVCKHLSYCFLQ